MQKHFFTQSFLRWIQFVALHIYTSSERIERKKEDKKLSIVRGSAELAAAFKEVEAAVLKVYGWQAHVMFLSQSA